MERGVLYMIPCPISDETTPWEVLPEANRRIMQSLDYFIVENTRTARRFLSKAALGLKIDELEFVELNEHTVAGEAIERMIAPVLEGRSAGVISEAGVPGVADPGALVVEAAHRKGIRVVPLIGPSSILLAVMASGLNGQSFAFNGYLPVKGPERQKAIRFFERRAHQEHQSQLFIEAPYRNQKLAEELLQTLQAETRLTIAMDLTAPTEWIRTLRVAEWRKTKLPELNKRPAIWIIG
ncbi:MAG: SAM-dependent methyltransferase [Alistipes sp.]|nr:SAM-dependent methyltransferase [Alistipes sp.]MBQ8652114.1 SAM-dependent methyltransferase [Alistipes sp.]MBR3773100.1 SAM-dependent methyltransferase [Alistipes sp.]MBR4052180.1 SAM-dependent methyltransferase [Alistipes sp.]